MTDIRERILDSAEALFDHHGFAATGMDRLTNSAGVSSRTLYKHLGSKGELIASVLQGRAERFFGSIDSSSVDALFAGLHAWIRNEGARGCLFLRAAAETEESASGIHSVVSEYHERLLATVRRAVENERGHRADDRLVEQILVLFEGAVSTATYRGSQASAAAREAAALVMRCFDDVGAEVR